jgi:hypothetical protein
LKALQPQGAKNTGPDTTQPAILYAPSDTGIGFKVWAIWRDGTKVTVEWGHEHKRKIRKTADLLTAHRAAVFLYDSFQKKLAKGYKRTK